MLERLIHMILPTIIAAIELIGIFVVTVGTAKAFVHYLSTMMGKKQHAYKLELASAMATGLEFKMAAEILKTVLVQNMSDLAILGVIIILRALLSFIIHIEIRENQADEPVASRVD